MPTSAHADRADFSAIFGEFETAKRADVGIGPYTGGVFVPLLKIRRFDTLKGADRLCRPPMRMLFVIYRTSSASSFLPRRRSMVFLTARKMFW